MKYRYIKYKISEYTIKNYSPVSRFSLGDGQPEQRISAYTSEQPTANCIAIFIYSKLPQCGYMEHGLEYITFYVQKHVAPLAVCSGLKMVRDKPLEAPAFVRLGS